MSDIISISDSIDEAKPKKGKLKRMSSSDMEEKRP